MKQLLCGFIISFFICAQSQADDFTYFKVDGGFIVSFSTVEGFIVNSLCADGPCEALKKAKQFQKSKVSPDLLHGGKNPGAQKCKNILGGTVIIGQDFEGNEQSVCKFKDGSYLI